jgi:glutamate N-acetyltransferase / amino-acid N-acetyltransferase
MPVRYTPPTPDQLLPVPGIALGTARARIKNWDRADLVMVVAEPGAVAAGVFTQNRFCAAPVLVCRDHLAQQHVRGIHFRSLIVNAGNANAGTGEAGLAGAHATCVKAAQLLNCAPEEILPFSTGVIMEPLPVDRIVSGLPEAHAAAHADGWFAAANAIMTTDTVPKGASHRVTIDGEQITVTGIAKGSGMIHPNMATMLSFMATDAPVSAALLARMVADIAGVSFNRATVDGDTSTNDSFVIAATGKARLAPIADGADPRAGRLTKAFEAVAVQLAQAIVRDGEGATKFISIDVQGGRDVEECRRIAFGTAHSPLVKTAFFASDPNLGRIICAIGNAASPDLDPSRVSFWLDDVLVVERGGRAASYREEDGQRVMKQAEVTVRVDLGRGSACATVWTCDLSHDYVTINAEYRS